MSSKNNEHEWLVEQFEANRNHLRAVAYRMLGSLNEADDAVQESWLHFSRSDTSSVQNIGGWLTTIVARICLDMLRSRSSRQEEPLGTYETDQPISGEDEIDPEHEALLADSVGLALLVVLDTLNPAERLAFVLHDIFAVPFEEIAPIVGRSPATARQLASRARRRVRGTSTLPDADFTRQRKVVDAFLAASRGGDFNALLTVLDPDVVFRADQVATAAGSSSEIRGAEAVAKQFSGRARGAQPALVNGTVGIAVVRQGELFLVLNLTITDNRIVEINAIADAAHLRQANPVVLDT
ncbi:RNA polymerase sigma factor [Reticulibacter mediterranei]|uniref:RNA polymerase sigma factor n=1 Tax=Reticulibacter mediterranei TaxID=2778369 RepID=A0A8J3N119_9CHLR|nr:sigma-70 family RNA polymerase sigma factor [Reticulibacter mediterranei]GHO93502.1 RNA polymerase sigma factor [Reticulibacter mediterranei]